MYVANQSASLVQVAGRWLVDAPSCNRCVEVSPPTFWPLICGLLRVAETACSSDELIACLGAHGIVGSDARTLLASLERVGLLVVASEVAAQRPVTAAADEVGRYCSLRRALSFADYSDPQVFAVDERLMVERLAEDKAPPVTKSYAHLDLLPLPHPATSRPDGPLEKLGHLLFWAFGKRRSATFLNVLPALLKSVPSQGARHPVEAYLRVRDSPCLAPGLYHYQVDEHALARVSDASSDDEAANFVLIVTALYERFQWRYRHSWYYKDLFFDVGHVQGNLRLFAARHALAVRPLAVRAAWHVKPLVEECLAAYDVGFAQEEPCV